MAGAIGILAAFAWSPAMAQQVRPAEVSEPEREATPESDEDSGEEINWDWTARIRPRMEGRFNHHFGVIPTTLRYSAFADESDLFSQQTRLGVRADRGKLDGMITAQHTAQWGVFGGDSLTLAPLELYQAWMRYQVHDAVSVQTGRFELAYGDQRVLGAVGWSQVGRAWDGLRVAVTPVEDVQVDVFGARYEDVAGGFLSGDAYLTGLYGTWSDPVDDVIDEADLYALYDLRWGAEDGPDRRQIFMVGARGKGGFAGVDVTAEGAYQLGLACATEEGIEGCVGPRSDLRGYFFDVEAGYTVAGFRPFVGLSQASGDNPDTSLVDEGYNQFYPTGHAFLGYMDLVGGRTNVREIRGGLQWQYSRLRHIVAVHDFTRLQPETERVGLEIDTKLFASLGEAFEVGGGYGIFFADQGMTVGNSTPVGPAQWVFLQATGTF